MAVTASSGVAGGAMGLLVALWRDRSFQSISLTILMVVFSVAGVEAFARAFPTVTALGVPLAEVLNPYRAMFAVIYPRSEELAGVMGASSLVYILVRLAGAALLVAFATVMLRVWNPGRNEPREQREGEGQAEVVETLVEVEEAVVEAPVAVGSAASDASGVDPAMAGSRPGPVRLARRPRSRSRPDRPASPARRPGCTSPGARTAGSARTAGAYRRPWANPILWRELMTRAYGTKPLIIKGAYVLIFAIGVALFNNMASGIESPLSTLLTMIPVSLGILSLVLVNAQGVTSLTSERDTGALDLLLVTELSPKEFIYGKLYGVLYNTKEMIALPVLWRLWLWLSGAMSGEIGRLRDRRLPAPLPLLGDARAPRGDHVHRQPDRRGQQPRDDLLPDGRHPPLRVPDHPERPRVRPPAAQLPDLHRGRQRRPVRLARGQEPVAGHRPGLAPDAVLVVLLHHQPASTATSWPRSSFSVGIYGFALLAMLVPAVSDFDIALGRTNAIQG